MNNQWIDAWIAQNREQVVHVQNLTRGLGSKDMHWNPAEGAWSIAQVLLHLSTTAKLYAPGIDKVLAKGNRTDPGSRPYNPGWMAKKFMGFVSPEYKKAVKAPAKFKPGPNPDSDGLEDFILWQEWLTNRMGAARLLDLNRPKMPSPALALLRFSLGEAFELLVTHTQRHINQAMIVRAHPEFPGPPLESCSN